MSKLNRRKRRPGIKYVTVQFKGAYRQYTYKTIDRLQPGDKVVAQSSQGLGTAVVFSTHTTAPNFDCKWVLGKIDLPNYEKSFLQSLKDFGINESDK